MSLYAVYWLRFSVLCLYCAFQFDIPLYSPPITLPRYVITFNRVRFSSLEMVSLPSRAPLFYASDIPPLFFPKIYSEKK